MVAPKKWGAYPHTDCGVEVRRVFHMLRRVASENFKSIFDVHVVVPTKGQADTARFALWAILVYQLALLYRHEHQMSLDNVGLKAFLRAARGLMTLS